MDESMLCIINAIYSIVSCWAHAYKKERNTIPCLYDMYALYSNVVDCSASCRAVHRQQEHCSQSALLLLPPTIHPEPIQDIWAFNRAPSERGVRCVSRASGGGCLLLITSTSRITRCADFVRGLYTRECAMFFVISAT